MAARSSWLQDRAGFGDVGVEGLDDGGVLLLDDAALELEGEGEAAIVERKIFGEKSEALDGLVLREMDGEALNFRFDQRAYPGMRGQLRIGGELDSLVGGSGGNGDGIGDDERGNKFAPITDDHGIQNVGARLQSVFDGLRSDEFSRRRFDQVFFAVGDEEIVVLVEIADVAGREPAVFGKNFTGGFGILVVALHDTGALDEDFTIFGDADLDV